MRLLRIALGTGLAAALLISLASTAAAEEEVPCRAGCIEAAAMCLERTELRLRNCRATCGEVVQAAIERAKAACEEQELDEDACRRLVGHVASEAAETCAARCRAIRNASLEHCRNGYTLCRRACAAGLDPQCTGECLSEFGGCKVELRTCRSRCEVLFNKGLRRCFAGYHANRDAEQYKSCLRQIVRLRHSCIETCHEDHDCGELHECIDQCRIDEH